MTVSQSALSELLEAFRAGEGADLVRDSVRLLLQELIELEAIERIGAGKYERSDGRCVGRWRWPAGSGAEPAASHIGPAADLVRSSAAQRESGDQQPEAGNLNGFELHRVDVVGLRQRFPSLMMECGAA